MTIENTIKKGKKGYYTGQRLILPFKCELLKVVFDNHIYTELLDNEDLIIQQNEKNTSIYIKDSGRLSNYVNNYEYIKLIACDSDADLTDRETHLKVICEIKDNHEVAISLADEDVLFIE